jgi:hypothetical protein
MDRQQIIAKAMQQLQIKELLRRDSRQAGLSDGGNA